MTNRAEATEDLTKLGFTLISSVDGVDAWHREGEGVLSSGRTHDGPKPKMGPSVTIFVRPLDNGPGME